MSCQLGHSIHPGATASSDPFPIVRWYRILCSCSGVVYPALQSQIPVWAVGNNWLIGGANRKKKKQNKKTGLCQNVRIQGTTFSMLLCRWGPLFRFLHKNATWRHARQCSAAGVLGSSTTSKLVIARRCVAPFRRQQPEGETCCFVA
jgi:hypothetical protein